MRWATRQRVVLILLLLVGGAIINVAVVAAISAYASRGSSAKVTYQTMEVRARDAIVLQRGTAAVSVDQMYTQYEARGFGWRKRMGNSTDQPLAGDDGRFAHLLVFDSGWPMLAAQGEYRSGDSAVIPEGFKYAWGRSRLVPSGIGRARDTDMLPLRPIWPGFAINTIFYATIMWLLFFAPFALRKRRRIKRGLCVKCAYPRGTSGRCTECGTPLITQNI